MLITPHPVRCGKSHLHRNPLYNQKMALQDRQFFCSLSPRTNWFLFYMNKEDKVIYTDGGKVTVTDSTFHVRKHDYKLNGIIKHGLYVMRPSRVPAILLVLIGLTLMVVGFAEWIPADIVKDVYIGDMAFGVNTMAMAIGGLIALIGVVIIGLLRDRYAVRISTAEGEKNVIVSSRKEYVAQIVDALTNSHYDMPSQSVSVRA